LFHVLHTWLNKNRNGYKLDQSIKNTFTDVHVSGVDDIFKKSFSPAVFAAEGPFHQIITISLSKKISFLGEKTRIKNKNFVE
jgi:hypothetical protein